MFNSKKKKEEMERWRQQAIEQQSFYCDRLSDRQWECYIDGTRDIIHLKNKIGYALFGPPEKRIPDVQREGNRHVDTSDNKHIDRSVEQFLSSVAANTETPISTLSNNPVGDDEKRSPVVNFECDEEFISFLNVYLKFQKPHKIMMTTCSDDCLQDDSIGDDNEHLLNESISQRSHINPGYSDDYEMYYSEPDQIKQIDDLLGKIKLCNGKHKGILIAFIFVIAKIDTNIAEFPIIRVYNIMKHKPYFVDPTGRCYKSWTGFLEDNFFPSCVYCYPKNGFYTPGEYNTEIEFSSSPEAGFDRKMFKYADKTYSLVGLGSGAVALASLAIPVAGPLLLGSFLAGGASGIWQAGRSAYKLIDRKSHNQEIFHNEAIGCWLSLATGVIPFAFTSIGTLRYTMVLSRNRMVIGRGASFLTSGIEITNSEITGIFKSCQGYNRHHSHVSDTGAQLAVSLLFFCNFAIRSKTAQTIVNERSSEVISGIESQQSRSNKIAFRKLAKNTADVNLEEGEACFIKTVMDLEDPQSYFEQLNRIRKIANRTNSTILYSQDESGRIDINWKVSDYLSFIKRSSEFQRKLNSKTISEFETNGKMLFSAVKVKDIINIHALFEELKNCKNYGMILSIIEEVKNRKYSNPMEVIFIILNLFQGTEGSNESYDKLVKFYEDNVLDSFVRLLEDIIDMTEQKLIETCNEQNENWKTLKKVFFRLIGKNDISSWDYFDYCLHRLKCEVPDKNSVIIVPQTVGWLFLCDDRRVHSAFVAVVRVSADVEKITCTAMTKY